MLGSGRLRDRQRHGSEGRPCRRQQWPSARNCVYHVRKWRRFEEDLIGRGRGRHRGDGGGSVLCHEGRNHETDHVRVRSWSEPICATRPHAEFKSLSSFQPLFASNFRNLPSVVEQSCNCAMHSRAPPSPYPPRFPSSIANAAEQAEYSNFKLLFPRRSLVRPSVRPSVHSNGPPVRQFIHFPPGVERQLGSARRPWWQRRRWSGGGGAAAASMKILF